MRNACKILVGKPEGKRACGKPRRRWEGNIRVKFREIDWKVVNWIHLARGRMQWPALENTVMNLRDR
jgi:hypothetical protein